jgi:hypothetical protein
MRMVLSAGSYRHSQMLAARVYVLREVASMKR